MMRFTLNHYLVGVLMGSVLLASGCGGKSQEGQVAAELAKAKKTSDPALKAKRLVTVAGKQHKAGDTSGAKTSLGLALDACSDIKKIDDRLKGLNSVAEAFARAGFKTDAEAVLNQVKEKYLDIEADMHRVQVATKMAEVYGRHLGKERTAVALLKDVEAAAEAVSDPAYRIQAMADVAVAYSQFDAEEEFASQMQKTLEAAGAIEDPGKRTDALIAAATRLIKVDKKNDARLLLDEADKLTASIVEPHSRAYALVSLAEAFAQAGDASAAKGAIQRADDMTDQVDSSLRGALKNKISETKKHL